MNIKNAPLKIVVLILKLYCASSDISIHEINLKPFLSLGCALYYRANH